MELQKSLFLKTILQNPYITHRPTLKQAQFLLFNGKEALYGGAAGGGKSDCLLMAAAQYVSESRYSAILFRRTFADLSLSGALMDRAKEWWCSHKNIHWNDVRHVFTFPSGAKIAFGYLETENDKFHYQGAEFQYIGFDELTQFSESQYRYLFSRLRRLKGSLIPLRARAASNPGGVGHEWVHNRFMIEGPHLGRVFVPAKLEDNPHLDQKEYEKSLEELDPITRRQYRLGDWNARHGGSIFHREKTQIVTEFPAGLNFVRYWDKAATKPKQNNKDPDYTVGVKLAEKNGIYYVADVIRARKSPAEVQALIKQTAQLDSVKTFIYIEQEPGSSGVEIIDFYARDVLKGYVFKGIKTTGSKTERAAPVSSAWDAGNFRLLQASWNGAFLDELEAFPLGGHDDQVDALSGAFAQLNILKHSFTHPIWV
ncbi:MAG: phage terminase large subunit [Nitrososphaerota archaeon]|nr:phage terminase large subunit [Nitrososphaerota archaeon]